MAERKTPEQIILNRDPRPQIDETGNLDGAQCTECGYSTFHLLNRCPECGSAMLDTKFGPDALVFSSTVVRIPVAERQPPYALAYVDVTRGPRILVHLADVEEIVIPGSRVKLIGKTSEGDPLAKVVNS